MSNQNNKPKSQEKKDEGPWKLAEDFLPKLRGTLMKLVADRLMANIKESVILAARLKIDRDTLIRSINTEYTRWEKEDNCFVPSDPLQASIDFRKSKV